MLNKLKNFETKLDKFIYNHLANLVLVITFTVIFSTLVVMSLIAGFEIRAVPTIGLSGLLLCDWLYLVKCWKKENRCS